MKRMSVAAGAAIIIVALAVPAAGQWQPGPGPALGYAPAPTIVYPGPIVPPTPRVPFPSYDQPQEQEPVVEKFLRRSREEARENDAYYRHFQSMGESRTKARNCLLGVGPVTDCGGW